MSQKTRIDLQDFTIKLLKKSEVDIYGFAYLRNGLDGKFGDLTYAISIGVKLDKSIVDSITSGPNQVYCDEYKDANRRLDDISSNLENEIKKNGYNALSVPASKRTDLVQIKGEFSHKTAATRAGLGWIGKNSLLITRKYGPRIRLSTILTDIPLRPGIPTEINYCGKCTECIDACPAKAIVGGEWYPGLPREKLVDVYRCDEWKKRNYSDICQGQVCGICMAVCPFGRKSCSTRISVVNALSNS